MPGRDDERALWRPRIGGRNRAAVERVPRFRQSVLARLEQRFSRFAGRGSDKARKMPRGPGAAADVPAPGPGARRCVIKARVVQLRARGAAAAGLHLRYIERDGVEADGSPGRLYAEGPADVHAALEAEDARERHQFRFIVSPEDGEKLDLTAFARDLMAQVERDTGRRLIWGAVNHYDTDNPHVHIVVRGVDAAGDEVRIRREYISEGMRWQAQHLVTRELGRRTDLDLARQMTREIRQERFTTLDRRLAERLAPGRLIAPRRLALTTDGASRARLVARLGVLAQLGVAERLPAGSWRLREDWEGALRALGERGDIIKRMHAAVHGRADAGRFVVLDGSAGRATVEGIVRRKGLHDELGGDQFAVVESAQGRAYYVRLDATAAEQVREGALVRVDATAEPWAKRIDQAIAAAARDAGGVYDPVAHLRHLEAAPPSIGGRLVDPKEVVAANVRRLERLGRYRIVTRAAGSAWKVPANLLGILAARETTHPRVRTTVDVVSAAPLAEVGRLRPTWLDAEKVADPTRAPYGFGAEISAAVRARSSFLEGLGIAAEGSERTHLLERAAERAVGEEFARARGATLVADPPPGFRGRLSVRDGHDGGPSVAVVIDEIKRAVVVLPATAVSPELVGQVVELGRDGSGRLVPQRSGLIRGE